MKIPEVSATVMKNVVKNPQEKGYKWNLNLKYFSKALMDYMIIGFDPEKVKTPYKGPISILGT